MATLQDFYDLISPSVQGCPVTILEAAVRASINEFCERTLIWNQEVFTSTLTNGEKTYNLNMTTSPITIITPLQAVIKKIKNNGDTDYIVLENTNVQDLDTLDPTWRALETKDPQRYYMETPTTISLVETPIDLEGIQELYLYCSVKPSRTTEDFPEFLVNDWAETIAHGALYRLHSISGRVWANPTMVTYHTNRFKDGISRAKSKMYKSYAIASKTMLPKSFINL